MFTMMGPSKVRPSGTNRAPRSRQRPPSTWRHRDDAYEATADERGDEGPAWPCISGMGMNFKKDSSQRQRT